MPAPEPRSRQHAAIALVVARARNGVIGRDGDLPWRLSSDLAHFKAVTTGKPIIMGRKTWESLPRRPLPGRLNIVITRQWTTPLQGALVVSSIPAALAAARAHALQKGVDEVSIIGGAEIYRETLPLADRLYLTEVDAAPEGDAFFPAPDPDVWQETATVSHPAGPKDDHAFVIRTLDRR